MPLTEVIGRKIHITDTGREFAELAKEIIQKTEELDERMTSKKGKVSGKLKLSVVSTGKYFVPAILADFKKAYPEVKITLDVSKRGESEAALLNYEADFMIATSSSSLDPYSKINFLPNPLVLTGPAVPVDFDSPNGKLLTAQLMKLLIIYSDRVSGTRRRIV